MQASFISSTSFSVEGDYTGIFISNRRIKANCGTDGYKYCKILNSSYSSPRTIVNISSSSDPITANLIEVAWSVEKPGLQGSCSNDWIDSNRHKWIDSVGQYEDAAGGTASDSFKKVKRRSRGSLSSPSSVVSNDQQANEAEQVYLNGSFRDILTLVRSVESIVGNNAIFKEVVQGNNGNGMVDISRRYGDGIWDFPKQSFVRVTKDDAEGFPNNTEVKIIYNDEQVDNQSEFDPVTNYSFTAKRAGVYHVDALITIAAGTSAGTFQIRAKKNSTVVAQSTYVKSSNSSNISMGLSFDIDMSAGDFFTFYVYQNSGATLYNTAVSSENYVNIRKVI